MRRLAELTDELAEARRTDVPGMARRVAPKRTWKGSGRGWRASCMTPLEATSPRRWRCSSTTSRTRPPRSSKEEVLTNIYEVLQTTLQNLRAMLRSLRSREVGPAGLVGELRDMATAYQRFHGLDVLLEVRGDEQELSSAHQEVVFQVIREALNNVRRHSQSGTCQVNCNFASSPSLFPSRTGEPGSSARTPTASD